MEGPPSLSGVHNCAQHMVDPNEMQGIGQLPPTAKSTSPRGYAILLTALHVDLNGREHVDAPPVDLEYVSSGSIRFCV